MGDASDALMRLRPVTFHYKAQPAGKEYGLIAEEVADIYPEAVVYKDGEAETVQYHKTNAMLLNEVQKQHAEIEGMKQRLAALEALLLGSRKSRKASLAAFLRQDKAALVRQCPVL